MQKPVPWAWEMPGWQTLLSHSDWCWRKEWRQLYKPSGWLCACACVHMSISGGGNNHEGGDVSGGGEACQEGTTVSILILEAGVLSPWWACF